MALEKLSVMYEAADRDGYAIGQFNFNNLEFAQAIIEAASESRSPAILACSSGALKYGGIEELTGMVKSLSARAGVPLALHLDHGAEVAQAEQCIRHGFTSVMIDASHEALEENIRITREVVELARPHGVTVEAELGRLGGIEDDVNVDERDARLTDPDEAERFVRESGCHALAVAVGTSHGAYKFKGDPRIDFARIETIRKRVGIPLVLHGASSVDPAAVALVNRFGGKIEGAHGLDDESYRRAIAAGVRKINIDTDLRLAWAGVVRQVLAEKPAEFDPRKVLGPAREAVKQVALQKMALFGSRGRS